MNLIEKEILIERLVGETWALYQLSVIGAMITAKSLAMPTLIVVSKGVRYAGRFIVSQKYGFRPTIIMNSAYITNDDITNLEETIAHELAHHIQWHLFPKAKQWHGVKFRFIMGAIGYDGNTYHYMSVRKAKETAIADRKSMDDSLFPL